MNDESAARVGDGDDAAPESAASVSDAAVADGAYHLTAAFVAFAVGQFVAGRVGEFAAGLDLGLFAYAVVLVPAVYLASRQFLRGVAVVVADAT